MQTVGWAKRFAIWGAVITSLIIVIAAAATLRWKSLEKQDLVPTDRVHEKIMWRVNLFARKATGGIPDLSWAELWDMAQHRGGFGLEGLIQGETEDGALVNPYSTLDDHDAGARIFRERCVLCHGIEGAGGEGRG
jgi:hypothetical protein